MLTQHFHQINIQRFAYKSEVCAKLKRCGIIVSSTGSNFLFTLQESYYYKTESVDDFIFLFRPCRQFCEAVRSGCESLLQLLGQTWPSEVSCDRFQTNDCYDPRN